MAGRFDLDEVPSDSRKNRAKPADSLEIAVLTAKYSQFRVHGPAYAYGVHWVDVKKADGSSTRFSTPCLAFDSATGRKDTTKDCPWCKHELHHPRPSERDGGGKGGYWVTSGVEYYLNALEIRKLKGAEPANEITPTKEEKASGFKSKGSDTFTPWVVLQLTAARVRKLQDIKELNVHEVDDESRSYGVTHPKYGCIVQLRYDKTATSKGEQFAAAKGEHFPMRKSLLAYLQWNLDNIYDIPSFEEAKVEYDSWANRHKQPNVYGVGGKQKAAVEDDDEDTGLKSNKSKASRHVPDEEDEDFEDEKPTRKPAKKKPDTDEEDFDEDFEDEKPARSKPSKKKPDPDEGDEDFEDEKPARKPSKKKPDPDEDFDDEDEDEDPPFEPTPKKSTKKPAPKKRPPVEDDEEEDF